MLVTVFSVSVHLNLSATPFFPFCNTKKVSTVSQSFKKNAPSISRGMGCVRAQVGADIAFAPMQKKAQFAVDKLSKYRNT